MHPMTSFKHTKVRRTSVCYVKCWGVRLQRKNCTCCHLYIASDEGTKSVSVCLSACLCGYLSMMTIHVSVQRGGAGGVWLAVTLILQRPWTQKKKRFTNHGYLSSQVFPHTGRYSLKDTPFFKNKQSDRGLRNCFHAKKNVAARVWFGCKTVWVFKNKVTTLWFQ